MTDILVYWRDFRKNTAKGNALRWHSKARVLGELLPGDRLWLVTSGQALKHEAQQAGFLVAVWQVAQVQPNPNGDPAYPAEDYKYRVTASEIESIIQPLANEGADIYCQVIVIAQGDGAIRENTVELGVKESLAQRDIKAEIQTG
jgi:hypothetical protein